MNAVMRYMTEGRTPRSKWYDGDCLLDRLKIYAMRIVIIALICVVFTLLHVPREYTPSEEPPPEMNCSRAGWGGDC